ncbi:putative prefoldin, alpha subunit [Cooperia oncophora]
MDSASTVLTGERLRAYSAAADKALAQVKGALEKKQKELQEYDSLIYRLEEMPKKRSEPVMCPIGSVGFLPATIVHTNEILIGLGDGYFVDTTAYHAAEILKRRKTVVEDNIADLHQHENIITQQIAFAKEIFEHQGNSDEVEIREEYDEEKEEELRKKRRSRIPANRPVTKTVADVKAEAEMMRRLEELEQQERMNGELNTDSDDADEADSLKHSNQSFQDKSKEIEEPKRPLLNPVPSQSDKPSSVASATGSVESTRVTCPGEEIKDLKPGREKSSTVEAQVIDKTVQEDGLSVGVFSGEDLIKALAEQDQVYDEADQVCQPPRGVDPKDFEEASSGIG